MTEGAPRKDTPEHLDSDESALSEKPDGGWLRRIARVLTELRVIVISSIAMFGAGFVARGYYDEWKEAGYANCGRGMIEVRANSIVPNLPDGVVVTLLAVEKPGAADFRVSDFAKPNQLIFGKEVGQHFTYVSSSGEKKTVMIAKAVVGSDGYICAIM